MLGAGNLFEDTPAVPDVSMPPPPDAEHPRQLGKRALKVMAVRDKDDRNSKTDYSKKHACLFCGQLDPKMARHLCSKKHENEKEIAQLAPPNKKGTASQAQRERVLDALRNEGDFLYNVDILKNGDENGFGLIVAKRPEAGEHIVKRTVVVLFVLCLGV